MSSQPIPVLPSVAKAYALLIAHWPRFVMAGLPVTLAYAVQLWLVQKALAAPLDGYWLTLDATVMIAATVGSLAFSAMCFRLAVRDEYGGQIGLQLSGDEWRFFLVALLNAALVVIVALLAAMFAFVVFTTIAGGAVEGHTSAPHGVSVATNTTSLFSSSQMISSGIKVFFIQNPCFPSSSITNSMPHVSHSDSLNINPWALSASVSAISTSIFIL